MGPRERSTPARLKPPSASVDQDYIFVIFASSPEDSCPTSNSPAASQRATNVPSPVATAPARAWPRRIRSPWPAASRSTPIAPRSAGQRRASCPGVASSRPRCAVRARKCARPAPPSAGSTTCRIAGSARKLAAAAPRNAAAWRQHGARRATPRAGTPRIEDGRHVNQARASGSKQGGQRADASVPDDSSLRPAAQRIARGRISHWRIGASPRPKNGSTGISGP